MKPETILGTAWTTPTSLNVGQSPPTLTLTITGTEDELIQYLDSGRTRELVGEIDQQLRTWIKHGGCEFESADQMMEWMRQQLSEVMD